VSGIKKVNPKAFVDITGKRFGMLVALRRGENRGSFTTFVCRCDCGVERTIRSSDLRLDTVTSCGCTRYVFPERIRSVRRAGYLRRRGLPESEITKATKALENYNGVCDVCGSSTPGGKGSWQADHDYETKTFRGILCHYCNTALGLAKDDIKTLYAMIEYLQRHRLQFAESA
jgi:hypothetical protein